MGLEFKPQDQQEVDPGVPSTEMWGTGDVAAARGPGTPQGVAASWLPRGWASWLHRGGRPRVRVRGTEAAPWEAQVLSPSLCTQQGAGKRFDIHVGPYPPGPWGPWAGTTPSEPRTQEMQGVGARLGEQGRAPEDQAGPTDAWAEAEEAAGPGHAKAGQRSKQATGGSYGLTAPPKFSWSSPDPQHCGGDYLETGPSEG